MDVEERQYVTVRIYISLPISYSRKDNAARNSHDERLEAIEDDVPWVKASLAHCD
jgi:hypothetical protein